ncbi:MAG TPA: FAD:protein FMN transferase [Hyphomonadaceae bacterium]|nr:FAD:protein FMN transferase [Hyphomonadaceae bacterium]
MSADNKDDPGAGPPTAGRLLIPVGLKPSSVRSSRIDAPIRGLSGATMGTGWSLAFAAPERIANADVVAALEETFARVIREMSGWENESELCRFNRGEVGWRKLPPDFHHVLSRAMEIAELTGGAYDPCLGARVQELGFGPSAVHPGFRRGERNKMQGWRDVRLDPDTRRAFQPGGVTLDLSSIAKGHAVDLCAARLKALGIASFLMEIGGEFAGEGVKPDGKPWWVELQLSDIPLAPGEPPHTDVALVNLALATSGDFVRRREDVSHLLDGRTGEPLNGALSGVSVMHASAMEADGWATAVFALGPEAGMMMADAQKLAVVFAQRTPEGARFALSRAASEMLG